MTTLDRPPRVHLLYNMNPITDPTETEEQRRPTNDYLCGYLQWRLDRLAHARRIAMSATLLEGFAHVPAEVTCGLCWETITALTRSIGLFANALRLTEITAPPIAPETIASIVRETEAIAANLRRPDSAIKRYIAESNAALNAAFDAIEKLPTPTPLFQNAATSPVERALQHTGAWMIATTTAIGDEHSWVTHIHESVSIWCQWCGVHRGEIADWMQDPPCPAIVAIRALDPPHKESHP